MATSIITSFGQQCDANGDPMSGAKVYVYDVGTTTLRSIYTDDDLDPGDAAANPIICDSAGRHDMRFTATGSYKIVVKTSADVTVYTRDEIDGGVPVGSGALAIANGGTGATSAGAALSNLGAATAAELADVAAEVASISGSLASTEKTHIATGTTAQRPASPVNGDIRRNTTIPQWEGYNGTGWKYLVSEDEVGTSGAKVPLLNGNNTFSGTMAVTGVLTARIGLLHVREEQAAGTDGGTFTSGAWRTRTLNTSLTNEITGASLGSNQITLPSGTYLIHASAPAKNVGKHQVKLRNTTDGSDTLIGHSMSNNAGDGIVTRSSINGRFTIAAQKVFELQHQCSSTLATVGLGENNNFGVTEVYSEVMIWKVL